MVMNDGATVLREEFVSITPAEAAYTALYADIESRSVHEVAIHAYGVMEQVCRDGHTHRIGVCLVADEFGNFTPAYSAENFLGIAPTFLLMTEGTPAWILQELEDYLAAWDSRKDGASN